MRDSTPGNTRILPLQVILAQASMIRGSIKSILE
jgi:hypothetical protein